MRRALKSRTTFSVAAVLSAIFITGDAGGLAAEKTFLVDTHMHLGSLLSKSSSGSSSGRQGSSDGVASAADELVRMLDARGIAAALVVTVPAKNVEKTRPGGNERQRDAIAAAVRRHPGRLFLMDGGATLKPVIESTDSASVSRAAREDFVRKAEAVLDNGAVGFGEMIVMHFCLGPTHSYQYTPPDHPLFLALADVAARRDVPIDIHMEVVPEEMPTPGNLRRACTQNPERLPATLEAFERFLAHNRGARIVWQHIGWDNGGYMTVDLLRRLLERHPNLHLAFRVEQRTQKVGELGSSMPNRIVDEEGSIRPEWLSFMRDFPDRLMIGADEFVGSGGGLTTEPHASFQQTWRMFDQIPPDLRDRIGGGNARRVYRIDPRPPAPPSRATGSSSDPDNSPPPAVYHPGPGRPPRPPRR